MKILENCKLFKLNKIKTIYKILNIPIEAQQKNFDFDCLYDFKFLKKDIKDNNKISKEERCEKYINIKKLIPQLIEERPSDFNKSTVSNLPKKDKICLERAYYELINHLNEQKKVEFL